MASTRAGALTVFSILGLVVLLGAGSEKSTVPSREPLLLPFDRNRDSEISAEEFAAAMRHLDLDKNGTVEEKELAGPALREFEHFDLNHDGSLDETELRKTVPGLRAFPQPKVALPDPERAFPPVPQPRGNLGTPAKVVLGKILFWDQQLSSNNTVACGSCHMPESGGADPREGRHPGADGKWDTGDDVLGSPGIAAPGEDDVQVTRRSAPSFFGALHAPELFWDGRAGNAFKDPIGGATALASGAALESQALFPILEVIEMSHPGRSWSDVTRKLSRVEPLARATKLTPDITAALEEDKTYPRLFGRAFGDPGITPVRIGMAIAAYERTLVADQTRFDKFIAGDKNALSANEKLGWRVFRQSNCAVCHAPPLFTDNTFRNVGVRAPAEDLGRAEVTKRTDDRGKFKVPSLRNAGLRARYMHSGRMNSLNVVISHYRARRTRSEENLDPLLVHRKGPGPFRRALTEFLQYALTDPRVKQARPPFDHPQLAE